MLLLWSFTLAPGKKTPKPKTIYIIHRMQEMKKGAGGSLIWQPILADGRKCRFSIFWQSYVVYVDKGENNCNITAACHEAWKGGFHSKLSPGHVERWMTCKAIPSGIWPGHAGLVFLLISSWGFSNCPQSPAGMCQLYKHKKSFPPQHALRSCRGDQKLSNREAF